MTFDQIRLILNSQFITSHFLFCPIVSIFHSSKINERINHIHERALSIVWKDFKSPFEELLIEGNSFNIHHRTLLKLVNEIFKVKNGLSPELINDVFEFIYKLYSLQTDSHFRSKRIRTRKCDVEVPSDLVPQFWSFVPNEYKTIASFAAFHPKMKTWVSENIPCRLCKTYLHQIGSI